MSGFDFRVTSLPGLGSRAENGSCDTVVEGGEGEGSLISLEHWHPPGTRCATTLRGRDHQVVSIVSYSRPSLMIIASQTQYHVYLP